MSAVAYPNLAGQWKETSCSLTDEWPACCCNCKHQAEALSHPETDGQSITHQRGLVCLAPEFYNDRRMRRQVVTEIGEHGMCEMWKHWSSQ